MSWERDVVDAVNGMAEEIAEIRKFQEACERDRDIGTLMQLNEKLMTQASNYTNLIMVAGYAGLFGLWSTLVGRLPQWLYALCFMRSAGIAISSPFRLLGNYQDGVGQPVR